MAWAAGLAIAGTSLSYLHCGKSSAGNVNFYPPCRERKGSGRIEENGVLIRYKRIQGDWYIYEFSNLIGSATLRRCWRSDLWRAGYETFFDLGERGNSDSVRQILVA